MRDAEQGSTCSLRFEFELHLLTGPHVRTDGKFDAITKYDPIERLPPDIIYEHLMLQGAFDCKPAPLECK